MQKQFMLPDNYFHEKTVNIRFQVKQPLEFQLLCKALLLENVMLTRESLVNRLMIVPSFGFCFLKTPTTVGESDR